jgi:hypothetical protein
MTNALEIDLSTLDIETLLAMHDNAMNHLDSIKNVACMQSLRAIIQNRLTEISEELDRQLMVDRT